MATTIYPAPTPAGNNNIGDVDIVTVPALVAGTANIGDVDVLTLPALVAGSANIGHVDGQGTAGTPSGGVVSVQGVASGTAQPVSLATLPTLVAGTANIGDVDVLTLPAIPTGANVIGAVTESGTWTVQPGNTPNSTAWLASLRPATSGGLTIHRKLAAATTNATSVKGSAGQVYGWSVFNNAAAVRFLKFYNKATAPTVGTDVPVMTIQIPAAGRSEPTFEQGIAFATGIAYAMTTGVADADTGALTANDLILNLFYA